jgi:hypothetical protein
MSVTLHEQLFSFLYSKGQCCKHQDYVLSGVIMGRQMMFTPQRLSLSLALMLLLLSQSWMNLVELEASVATHLEYEVIWRQK